MLLAAFFTGSGDFYELRAPDRAIEVAIAIVIAKTLFAQSGVSCLRGGVVEDRLAQPSLPILVNDSMESLRGSRIP